MQKIVIELLDRPRSQKKKQHEHRKTTRNSHVLHVHAQQRSSFGDYSQSKAAVKPCFLTSSPTMRRVSVVAGAIFTKLLHAVGVVAIVRNNWWKETLHLLCRVPDFLSLHRS